MDIFLSCEAHISAGFIIGNNIRIIDSKIKTIKVSDYTDVIDDIGIIINCFPIEEMNAGWGKRREYISYKNRFADIRLPIDFDELVGADRHKQYLMVVDNIVESLNVIKRRLDKKKLRFDAERMTEDILRELEVNQ
ncbi:MAG: Imm44 family immunity protein [Ruminococcus sp.]|nr:Imm44 family immunity protein [Ruminococcus sp.]MCM1380783.1 Imm44 family immunity protein [Muribaculaceae bacterium]MCM1480175.1 Imm44 family immunity protein [Muribaculaceae bacterium]